MSESGGGANPDEGVPVGSLSYTEASRELDDIVAFFEQRDVDVDQLVSRLERATTIVDELDRRLKRTRARVEKLVPRLESAVASDDEGPSSRDIGDEDAGDEMDGAEPRVGAPDSPGLF
jgi:exodeoxyribonuclease VII small subunit